MARSRPTMARSGSTMWPCLDPDSPTLEEEDRAPSVEEVATIRSKELIWELQIWPGVTSTAYRSSTARCMGAVALGRMRERERDRSQVGKERKGRRGKERKRKEKKYRNLRIL